ncbi:MAG TPA: flagellar filament capping protein FliD, partial [Firmicutes bacterium]|nr:flagellar filament capping protein FliD [Bacillota bacterium]
DKNVATSSRTDVLTVNATGNAHAGTYDLEVKQLAKSARFVPTEVNLPTAEGDHYFHIMGERIDISEGDTLSDIAKKINDNKELGISAYAHDEKISFTTKATGSEAKITVDTVDDKFVAIFGNPGEVTGQDAEVTINGLETTQSNNTFDLNGVTVNLLSAPEPEGDQPAFKVRVEVRQDVDAVVDKIKEFVNIYNELVDELNVATREKVYRDFPPLTDAQRAELSDKEIELWEEKAKSGLLRSDSIITGILSEMRMALSAAVKDGEGSMTLADIGITTGSWYEYGRLNINESKLRAAVESDPEGVSNLFRSDGAENSEMGIARRLEKALDNGMKRIDQMAGKAESSYDRSFLSERIRDYESRLSVMEERLLRYEEMQWRKFTAMEKVLGQLYSQSDWLTQQLFSMQG